MNTIDDLRETLGGRAAGMHDDNVTSRAREVHTRVRRVRRRRTAAAGVVAAVVVAAASVVALRPGSDRAPVPAERELIGREAPATMQALGYTYAFADGVESGREPAAIELPRSDEPRLLTWAAQGTDSVDVVTPVGRTITSPATDFTDFIVIPPGDGGRYGAYPQDHRTAVAVYELTDAAPPGITVDRITFREDVGSERLVGADIAEEGQADLTFSFIAPEGVLSADLLCSGGPQGSWVHLKFGGGRAVSTSGCQDLPFDPGAGGEVGFPGGIGFEPGEEVTASVRVTEGQDPDGPLVSAAGLKLGLGLYEEGSPVDTLAGSAVPELYEYEGHSWGYVRGIQSGPGDARLVLDEPAREPMLAIGSYRGVGGSRVVATYAGVPTSEYVSRQGGIGGLVIPIDADGGAAGLEIRGAVAPDAELGLAVYRRID